MPLGIYIRTKKWKWDEDSKIPREIRICKRQECNNKFEIRITSIKKYCSRNCSNKNHKIRSKEHCKNLSKALTGKHPSEETKRKISKTKKGYHHSKETKEKIRKSHIGIPLSKEHIRKMCEPAKKRGSKLWRDPKYRKKQLKAIFAGLDLRPTKPERRLRNRLNHLFPNEYKYVGNGSILIGFKNPDFININGQKKIIEMFGNYWHGEERTGRTKRQEENQRIKHFAKYGYKTLIVWENELKNISKLKKKLAKFYSK